MSDVSPVTDEQRAREAAAKQRFFALSLFRLSGVFILMFGFLIMLQKFSFVSGEKAKIMGAIIACVGMFQTIIIPRLLARARSEENTSELQSLMRISYAVFRLKKTQQTTEQ